MEAGISSPFTHDEVVSLFNKKDSPLYWRYITAFNCEEWYHLFPAETFLTAWLALDVQEAKAFMKAYRHDQLGWEAPTEEEREKVRVVGERIEKKMEILKGPSLEREGDKKGFFVRMSARSPKDVGLDIAVSMIGNPDWNCVVNSLSREEDGKGDDSEEERKMKFNQELRALMIVCGRGLVVEDGPSATSLLTQSERVFGDLLKSFDAMEDGRGEWKTNIIIREWVNINPEDEFRCFVANQRIVAISQYNDVLYYPHLANKNLRNEIVHSILASFEKIREKLLYSLYVIDFAFHPTHTRIIELNPAGPITGGALFNWTNDLELLTSKQKQQKPKNEQLGMWEGEVAQEEIENVFFRYRTKISPAIDSHYEMMVLETQRSLKLKAKRKKKESEQILENETKDQPKREIKEQGNPGCAIN